jgi:hypothetical protein
MNVVPIKYTGTREWIIIDIAHERFNFNKDNNYTLNIPEKLVPNFMKRKKFMPISINTIVEVEKVKYRNPKKIKGNK